MFCLNSRQIEMIELLIKEYEPISINTIASQYGVSTRTIRYDLELIDGWLNENKATLVKIHKKGIMIKTRIDREILLERLKFLSVESRVLSDKERVKYLVLELLISEKPLTIKTLSEKLFLSRNTIMKTLKDTKKTLKESKLELSKSSKGGFFIEGSEKRIRKFLLNIFLDILDSENLSKLLREEKTHEEISDLILDYNSFVRIDEMKIISQYLIDIEEINNYYLTDVDFIKLILYIEIYIRRCEKGKVIDKTTNSMKQTIEYEMSMELVDKISTYKGLEITIGEINEMAKYIIESKSFNTINELKRMSVKEVANEDIIRCTTKILTYVEESINIDIKNDKQLFNGLVLHLKSALARIRNDNQIKNQYLDTIKTNYPFVFQVVSESLSKMRDEFCNDVNEDEVAYIVLHIRAAYERINEKAARLTALLICPEGISFLSLLSTKIKKEIPNLSLVETCSTYDYQQLKREVDFVISTESLNISHTDIVNISPFMNNDDIYKIKQLMIQLNKFRLIYKYNYEKKGVKMLMLKDILKKESIQLRVEANNWEEAINKSGEILVQQGKVEQKYVDNMVQAIKDLGPYIVIMPGIAFAHARPDDSVKETCMSMITLANPVEFGSEHNDPVQIVFAFAAINGEEHLKALQDLAKFLAVEKNQQLLINSKDIDDVYNKIISE